MAWVWGKTYDMVAVFMRRETGQCDDRIASRCGQSDNVLRCERRVDAGDQITCITGPPRITVY
jgi:hypothetical protein